MSGQLEAQIYEGGESLQLLVCSSVPRSNLTTVAAGSNLSQGQRQLISLARALLTPTNILVLDEATVRGSSPHTSVPPSCHPVSADFSQAAVDIETDAMLQTTLRSNMFKDRTIITIAHRINTILDSDRIIVLDHGRVAEFDTPSTLIRKKGLFYELVRESGLLETFES